MMTTNADDEGAEPLFWAGIGASAGGLEALRSLIHELPGDLPTTYVVAQHMAPRHKSLLTEIIGRETPLPVLDATDDLRPSAGTIYITPPNTNVVVRAGRIRLEPLGGEKRSPKPSVDVLLDSLAEDRGEHAIGIILSGTGRDGAAGIRAIRERGGVTIAQDEHTAKYTGMPLAAQGTGAVDLVLSPEEIGRGFRQLTACPRNLEPLRAEPASVDALAEVTRLLYRQTKVDFSHYKSATVQRRIERRMAAVEVDTIERYLHVARGSADEVDALFKDLMITVTSFFRDPEEFDALRGRVESLVEHRRGEEIRVWVAGVATGEEVYTLTLLFAEAMGGLKAFTEAPIQFFATDIDAEALGIARRGFYPEASLATVDDDLVRDYFDASPGGYTVRKHLREKIVFSLHDVARDPPFLNLDLISCRNLMIYFQAELQAQVFDRFHYALRDDALLFLGKSEAVSVAKNLFVPAHSDRHLFIQRSSRRRKLDGQPFPDRLRAARREHAAPRTVDARELDAVTAQLESLIDALGPNALLVSEDARLLKVYGSIDAYLGISGRAPVDTTVTSLLRNPWAQDIRVAVPGVLRNDAPYEGLTRADPADESLRTRLLIYPMRDDTASERMALVVFRTWRERETTPARTDGDAEGSCGAGDVHWRARVAELTRELDVAKANLQSTVEELETSNEELQAVNEELQSSNEELQSTNEELETSSEELQSTNEELSTVNEELNLNAQRLSEVNESQRSILDNMVTPMIVLDRRMYVVDASLSAAEHFRLPPGVDEPHLSRCGLPSGFPSLDDVVRDALAGRERLVRQINTATLDATLSVAPYYGGGGELSGAIVQISDNAGAVGGIRGQLELIFEHTPAALVLCDTDGRVVNANARARRWLDIDLGGFSAIDIRSRLPEHLRPMLEGRPPAAGGEASGRPTVFALQRPGGASSRWMSMHTVPFVVADGGRAMLLVVLEDVTDRHEEALRNVYLRTRMDLALSASDIGTWESDRSGEVQYWSPRTVSIMGRAEGFQPRPGSFLEQVHPDDRAEFERGLAVYTRGEDPHTIRVRVVRENGGVRWVSIRGRRYRGGEGERLIGTVIDETEIIDQLEQLKARNNHLQLAETLSGTGYWSVNIGTGTIAWSEQVYRIHGVDSESFVPTLEQALAFYHEDDVGTVRGHIDRAIEGKSAFRFTARIERADGDVRTVQSLGLVQLDDLGNTADVFGVFRDITETVAHEQSLRDARDEVARSNEELSRFSYVCSHDLKEPVRLIESMSDLLQEPGALDDVPDARELLGRIGKNTRRLKTVIDSLLAYSRVEARIEFVTVDLNEVVAEIRENLSLLIDELEPTIEVGALPVVRGARVHFVQLFQNLIGNALTYSDKACPLIAIRAAEDEGAWRISVEDNGPGVPEDQQGRVFEVFTRLELSSSVEGSGLGLSICKRIVGQYDGSIDCSDGELGGARFTIHLPRRDA